MCILFSFFVFFRFFINIYYFNMHYTKCQGTLMHNDLFSFSVRQVNCTGFGTAKQILCREKKRKSKHATENRTRSESSLFKIFFSSLRQTGSPPSHYILSRNAVVRTFCVGFRPHKQIKCNNIVNMTQKQTNCRYIITSYCSIRPLDVRKNGYCKSTPPKFFFLFIRYLLLGTENVSKKIITQNIFRKQLHSFSVSMLQSARSNIFLSSHLFTNIFSHFTFFWVGGAVLMGEC